MTTPTPRTRKGKRATQASTDVLQRKITLCFGRSNRDTNPCPRTMTFAELIADFSVPDTKRGTRTSAEYHALRKDVPEEKKRKGEEKNGRYFNVARFTRAGTRLEADVAGVISIALDFDSGRTTKAIIRKKLAGYTYLAYTSYSHLPGNERWRAIVFFSAEVSKDLHKRVYKHFQELFEGDLDPRSGVASQLWYTPACPHDAVDTFKCFHEIGEFFDPSTLPEEAPAPASSKPAKKAKATTTMVKATTMAKAINRAMLLDAQPDPNELDSPPSLKRLVSALGYVNADDRDTWIEAGLAIKHDLGEEGLELWMEWSKKSPKFDDDVAVATWESFKERDDGEPVVTLGTVFHKAREAGWDDVPSYIAEMNEEYFVAPLGRHVEIFREYAEPQFGHRTVAPMDKDDFQLKHDNKFVTVTAADGTTKRVDRAKAWRTHRSRREYEGVVLAPNREVPGYYNRWTGFAVQPVKLSRQWRRMRWHLLFVICSGDRRLYRYVLGWLAFGVQQPGKPAEVTIVLQGGRGTGKGMFVSAVGRIFGLHFKHVTHSRHFVGNFNGHLADCILLFVDEAFWAGDKQGESVLKGLVTESTIAIERKGLDVEHVPNMLKIIMASNNDWVVPAGVDERRFCVLAVSSIRQQDLPYFAQLKSEIDNGGPEAMLYDLLHRDLSRFDIRQVPQTAALKDQKLLSLSPMMRWWMDKLTIGYFVESSLSTSTPGAEHHWESVPKKVMHEDYVSHLQKTGVPRKSSETELGMALRKVLPKGYPTTPKPTLPPVPNDLRLCRAPHYGLPPLTECRAYFEKLAGMEGREWG